MGRNRTVVQGIICVMGVIVSLLIAQSVYAESNRPQVEMSRQRCIANALENNLDIKISQIDPLRGDIAIDEAWGVFDPLIDASIIDGESTSPGGLIDVQGIRIERPTVRNMFRRIQLGLSGTIPTGTSYALTYENSRFDSVQGSSDLGPREDSATQYRGSTQLRLTQSLLRGWGLDVNLAQIRIAAISKDMDDSQLARVIMETVASVQYAYWDLVFTREDLEVKKKSLVVAEDLLDRNRRKLAIGTAARFEVDQAEAGVAGRESDIIAAEAGVRFAEDQLKFVMNLRDDTQYWAMEIVPVDTAEVVVREVDLDQEIESALALRPEIRRAEKNIDAARIALVSTRNQVLPRVDLTASYGYGSLQPSRSREQEYLVRAEDYSYTYGIIGSIPIGNRSAKARHTDAKHLAKQATLTLEALKKRTAIEVRDAVRAVTTNLKLVEANRATRELREKTLDDEHTRYEVGVSTSYQVLEVEEDVAEARSTELSAIVNYRKSLVNLDLADGTILEKNGIEFTPSAD